MGRPAPAQAELLSFTARSRVGGTGYHDDLVCSVSGSRSVRLGDVLSDASPDRLGSDPGPSGMGLEGSCSVRLVLATSRSGSGSDSGPVWLASSVSGPAWPPPPQLLAPAPCDSETSCPARWARLQSVLGSWIFCSWSETLPI
jgi:hypothetical protein